MPVILSEQAEIEFARLSATIQERVLEIFERLEDWPRVSGVKWLRGELKNHARIRTGDYRVIFKVVGEMLMIVRVAHRRDVYED